MRNYNIYKNLNTRSFQNSKKALFTTQYQPKSKEDIVARVHKYNVNTITMGFPDLYGRFIGKKYDPDYFVDKALKNGSNACNYLLSCDMTYNPIPNTNIASYEKGFGDFTMKADMDSVREITYINDQKQLLFFADLVNSQNEKPITHAPRYLLRQSIQELKNLGLSVQVECDINFSIFYDKYRKLSENFHHAQTVTEHSNLYNTIYQQNLDEFFNKLKTSLKTSGIHVEKMTGDKAPGQFRLSLKACDILEFSDNITLLKLCIKKLADESDKSVSFMAKLNEEWLGNSLDLKLIIKDEKNNNILDSFKYCNDTKNAYFKESLGEHCVAGIIKHLPDFFIFYAPTVNSYKRLKEINFEEHWNKFGHMQDDCGVNIIDEKNNQKILFTLTGADVNPYLSLFSILSSIKSGIDKKLHLKDSLKSLEKEELPINLNEANNKFQNNEYMKTLLGEVLHQHLWAFYNLEYTEFMNQVDEWELNRYLFNI